MNEEQAALDFFSQPENLPLALTAAEHIDSIRLRLNNEFWTALRERLATWLKQQNLPWTCEVTEDRNAEDCLVGLHLEPTAGQHVFLRPFMEQQFLGDSYRVFYGLMWNSTPDAGQRNLPAVETLRLRLGESGLKHSDTFLAWQWLPWYPRRGDFLIRVANQRDGLMEEAMRPWEGLLADECGAELKLANDALAQPTTSSTGISLDALRSKLPSQSGN